MKKIVSIILVFGLLFVLASCGNKGNIKKDAKAPSVVNPIADRPLVVYFSRTGEQYGVGNIAVGNTAVVAKLIGGLTHADMFEIVPASDTYPTNSYDDLTKVAKLEQSEKARPAYVKDKFPDLTNYTTIFIGSPVWWGDWPMILYTFFESENLAGKMLYPFNTNGGSGLAGFDKKLASAVPGATVGQGLAVKGTDCQKNMDEVRTQVKDWLTKIGYNVQ